MRALRFDVIVIGGGHAGAEAAWAAARCGADTALVTMDAHAIGRMSCNPAIGGLGKGQMVREIDALGGIMGIATDRAGLQFRTLNKSKGPAVWAPRAQCDRELYAAAVQDMLSTEPRINVIEGLVDRLLTGTSDTPGLAEPDSAGFPVTDSYAETAGPASGPASGQSSNSGMPVAQNSGQSTKSGMPVTQISGQSTYSDTSVAQTSGQSTYSGTSVAQTSGQSTLRGPARRITGVVLEDGRVLNADAVIVTTGTFLRALMHCGLDQTEGGRVGEQAARGMSASLHELGFELMRLKTGTPPRVHRDTVDYDQCEEQPGDDPPVPLSYVHDFLPQEMRCCWITWTSPSVHELITNNLHQAPMYSGQIASTGPRYCPSIEDKVVRFADKTRHQVFLEPEGYDNDRIYCNGISTSLPDDVQRAFIRMIPGLARAKIVQPGYAVEYDCVPTHQICATLETKPVRGLFLAGQINGTSGYEEAAAQGLMAGVNAVRLLRGQEAFVLGRDRAYIGVMIDDLITSPPQEPYRMFTSRAEYRLMLRADNADQRLTPTGRELGLVDDRRWTRFTRKRQALQMLRDIVQRRRVGESSLEEWARRPQTDLTEMSMHLAGCEGTPFCTADLEQLLIDTKYQGYVDRQNRQVEKLRRLESVTLPENIDYARMPELRLEAREKLASIAPRTLGQAGRISGINPADVTVLWVYLSSKDLPQTA